MVTAIENPAMLLVVSDQAVIPLDSEESGGVSFMVTCDCGWQVGPMLPPRAGAELDKHAKAHTTEYRRQLRRAGRRV